jgi:hypothetical protein
MIAAKAHRYCREDLSLVENYAEALADNTRTWHIHHRDEIRVLPSGMVARRSIQDLIDAGRYYNCPANELIFVTPELHNTMHFRGGSSPMKGKHWSPEMRRHLSRMNAGKVMTPEWHSKHSAGMMGHKVTEQGRENMRQAALRREAKKRALKEATNA